MNKRFILLTTNLNESLGFIIVDNNKKTYFYDNCPEKTKKIICEYLQVLEIDTMLKHQTKKRFCLEELKSYNRIIEAYQTYYNKKEKTYRAEIEDDNFIIFNASDDSDALKKYWKLEKDHSLLNLLWVNEDGEEIKTIV